MDGISASIVTYNCKDTVKNTVETLQKHTKGCVMSLYCFDNGSTDGTADLLSGTKGVTFVNSGGNIGFGKAHNLMLKREIGKYHAVINPDIAVSDDVLSKAAEFLDRHTDIVMLAPVILNADGTVQKLPRRKPTFKYMFLGRFNKKVRGKYTSFEYPPDENGCTDINCCTGCFFVIRGDVFKALGGFDERFFMYLEDADITLRAKKYGRVVQWDGISVTHLWQRESAKKIKYILIHTLSAFKFIIKWRGKS